MGLDHMDDAATSQGTCPAHASPSVPSTPAIDSDKPRHPFTSYIQQSHQTKETYRVEFRVYEAAVSPAEIGTALTPPPSLGDLFKVRSGPKFDVWLFESTGQWKSVEPGVHNPVNSRLVLADHRGPGDFRPNWILKKSFNIGQSRSRKRQLGDGEVPVVEDDEHPPKRHASEAAHPGAGLLCAVSAAPVAETVSLAASQDADHTVAVPGTSASAGPAAAQLPESGLITVVSPIPENQRWLAPLVECFNTRFLNYPHAPSIRRILHQLLAVSYPITFTNASELCTAAADAVPTRVNDPAHYVAIWHPVPREAGATQSLSFTPVLFDLAAAQNQTMIHPFNGYLGDSAGDVAPMDIVASAFRNGHGVAPDDRRPLLGALNIPCRHASGVRKLRLLPPSVISDGPQTRLYATTGDEKTPPKEFSRALGASVVQAGSLTSPHYDGLAATQVQCHFEGRKLWFFWPLTRHNLREMCTDDATAHGPEHIVRAIKKFEGLEVVLVDRPCTYVMPPGCIHAVWTLTNSCHVGTWYRELSRIDEVTTILRAALEALRDRSELGILDERANDLTHDLRIELNCFDRIRSDCVKAESDVGAAWHAQSVKLRGELQALSKCK